MLLDRCVQYVSTICNKRMGIHAIGSLFPITIAPTRPMGVQSWESVTQYLWYGMSSILTFDIRTTSNTAINTNPALTINEQVHMELGDETTGNTSNCRIQAELH